MGWCVNRLLLPFIYKARLMRRCWPVFLLVHSCCLCHSVLGKWLLRCPSCVWWPADACSTRDGMLTAVVEWYLREALQE